MNVFIRLLTLEAWPSCSRAADLTHEENRMKKTQRKNEKLQLARRLGFGVLPPAHRSAAGQQAAGVPAAGRNLQDPGFQDPKAFRTVQSSRMFKSPFHLIAFSHALISYLAVNHPLQ